MHSGFAGLEGHGHPPGKYSPLEILRQDGQVWDLFVKAEEYRTQSLDRHSRFPFAFSAYKDCLDPKVSRYLVDRGLRVEYPDGKQFAVCLTHDIDSVYFSRDCFLDVYNHIGQGMKWLLPRIPFYLLKQRSNPIWNFKEIIDLEKGFGAKSNFFFMASDMDLGRRTNYRIESLEGDIGQILDEGWDVGLHGGYHSYRSAKELQKEKYRLEKVTGRDVKGCRNHYLRFRVPETWEVLSKAGFKYDTTFGYADFVGFRNGMCHPFKPFDLNSQSEVDILEIPLTVMDCTLFDYMCLDAQTAWKFVKQAIDTAEKNNGIITVLWHNTNMLGANLTFYRKILEYCREKNAWMASSDDVWDWWNHRRSKGAWV